MTTSNGESSRGQRAWLIAIFVIATLLRLRLNNVDAFSPADESVYVDLSQRFAAHGFLATYGDVAREWVANPSWWRYPNPLRCGYLALTTAAVQLYGRADARALAWLSTLAGILAVPLLYEIARRLAGMRAALLAASFAAVSPIELAMGRRALQDEVLCLAALLAFAAILGVLEDASKPVLRTLAAIAALTFAISIKETFLLLFPALALFVVFYVRPARPSIRHVAMVAIPPLLWWLLLAALTRDLTMPARIARLVANAMSATYVVQYQSGPPHRLLFDFFLTAPLVSVLAAAAIVGSFLGLTRDRRMHALAIFLLAGFASYSLLASKNLRFIVLLDPFVCVLAASIVALPRRDAEVRMTTVAAAAAANAAIALELFRAIFITGAVYDPVTQPMLAALGAVPRSATSAPPAMLWPWICAAIAAMLWLSRHIDVRSLAEPLHRVLHRRAFSSHH